MIGAPPSLGALLKGIGAPHVVSTLKANQRGVPLSFFCARLVAPLPAPFGADSGFNRAPGEPCGGGGAGGGRQGPERRKGWAGGWGIFGFGAENATWRNSKGLGFALLLPRISSPFGTCPT